MHVKVWEGLVHTVPGRQLEKRLRLLLIDYVMSNCLISFLQIDMPWLCVDNLITFRISIAYARFIPQIAWNLIKSSCLRISLMGKFRWEHITLVWLEYAAKRTLQEYVGFLECYCPKTILIGSHFSGVIHFLWSTPGSKPRWTQFHELRLSRRQPADLGGGKASYGDRFWWQIIAWQNRENQLVHFIFYFPTICFFPTQYTDLSEEQ